MQKFLQRPVAAPLFAFFGVMITQAGYAALRRGFVEYLPQNGPKRIFSPTNDSATYWALSVGMLVLGLLLFALSAYSILCIIRAHRAGDLRIFRGSNRLGLIMIILASILIILAIIFR
jgi:hypothetical protein